MKRPETDDEKFERLLDENDEGTPITFLMTMRKQLVCPPGTYVLYDEADNVWHAIKYQDHKWAVRAPGSDRSRLAHIHQLRKLYTAPRATREQLLDTKQRDTYDNGTFITWMDGQFALVRSVLHVRRNDG